MWKKSGTKNMYLGWGAILPKQAFLTLWNANISYLDFITDEALGTTDASSFSVIIKEICLGIGGYLLLYPVLTAQRRVAAQANCIGIPGIQHRSVSMALLSILRTEGISALYRGLAVYSVGASIWVLAMPTMTQFFWLRYEDSARSEIQELLRLG